MRTTIEITDRQRAELLRLAAMQGEKGFSALIQTAIDQYLAREPQRKEKIAHALRLKGTLDEAAANNLLKSVQEMRMHWR